MGCWSGRAAASALDGDVDEVAPLGPRAVLVLDVLVAEQLAQDEPGVRAPLADPAVRRHLLVRRDALAAVELAQLVRRLERAVVADGLRPRDRLRRRDVTGARGALLLVAGRRHQLARVLLGAAHVDEREAAPA